jgi:hypothetical protein
MNDPIQFLPRDDMSVLLNEPLVDDSVRAQAEAEVVIHLNAAIAQVCNCVELTYHDSTFRRLISGLKELKALQREIEVSA